MGPSINDVACLEGGRGVKLTIWGDMRGVGVKENPISSINDKISCFGTSFLVFGTSFSCFRMAFSVLELPFPVSERPFLF